MALPACAAACTAVAAGCSAPTARPPPATVYQHLLPGGGGTQHQTHHTAAVVDRRDRQTNRRMDSVPLHRPCSAYYVSSANKQLWPQPFHSTMLVEITRPRPFMTARAQHHVMTVTHTTSTLTECNLSTATAPSVF